MNSAFPRALLVVVGGLAACVPMDEPATNYLTISTQLQAAPTDQLWATYTAPGTDAQTRLMTEAELAARGETQFAGRNLGTIGAGAATQVGVARYNRTDPSVSDNSARDDVDCGDFSSAAAAQRFFLAAGGPASDPNDLDRDGDGFACEWGTEARRLATRRISRPVPVAAAPRAVSSSRCYTGPRGGTYTITASGAKDYDGC